MLDKELKLFPETENNSPHREVFISISIGKMNFRKSSSSSSSNRHLHGGNHYDNQYAPSSCHCCSVIHSSTNSSPEAETCLSDKKNKSNGWRSYSSPLSSISHHFSISQNFIYQTILISLLFLALVVPDTSAIVVQTKIGKIRGLEEETLNTNTKYFAFKGIRYASAPVKEYRFKAPRPIPAWEGILDATRDGPACPQFHVATNQVIGQEDCLTLNIYTRELDTLKPVIVFIHSGGYLTGTGSSLLYGPDYLIDENVVVVSIQYRLGVFGFLSTGTKEAQGNWGILDQIEALTFLQGNIAAFGGDSTLVTIGGEGAGAASASLLTFLEQTKGLYKSVIALGGTALNSQYFQRNPVESARELVSRLQCPYEDFGELVDCLRKEEMSTLVKETNNMLNFFSFPRWFVPSIDNVLLSQTPEELLKKGQVIKVPVLTGISRHEGAFYYPLTINSFNDGKYDGNFIDQRLPRLLPIISEFESKLFPITKAVKKRYFTNVDLENEDEFRPRYIEFLTDLLFTRFTNLYANGLANQSVPVYYYVLDYYGSNGIMNIIGDTDMKSIAHGDILQYIFTQVLGEENHLPSDDLEFATKTFIPLLVNFAKTGNPTPSARSFGGVAWPKFNAEDQTVCLVRSKLSLQPQFRSTILKFWSEDIKKLTNTKKEEL